MYTGITERTARKNHCLYCGKRGTVFVVERRRGTGVELYETGSCHKPRWLRHAAGGMSIETRNKFGVLVL